MKKTGCEHEEVVLRAMHTGEWTDALRRHLAECRDCTQVLQLAEALRQQARRAEGMCSPPDPYWILQRARRQARELTLRRVGRLLAAMRILAAVYAVAVAAWLLRGYAALQYREVASALPGTSSGYALLGAAVAAAFAIAGLWPILRQDTRRAEPGRIRPAHAAHQPPGA
jgi:hypothetical protein